MHLVVEIAARQVAVEGLGEGLLFRFVDRPFEFDDQQVAAEFTGPLGEQRAAREVSDADADLPRCRDDRGLDFLARQMLAKSRECVGEPSGHRETRRAARDATNRVTDRIGPKPRASGDHDRIIDTDFDVADPVVLGPHGIDLRHRHEPVEMPLSSIRRRPSP